MDKQELQKRIEDELGEWSARMDILRAKAEKANKEAGEPNIFDQKLVEISRKKEEARKKFAEFLEASEDSWEELVSKTEQSVEDFKKSVDKALSELTDIEPLDMEEHHKKR